MKRAREAELETVESDVSKKRTVLFNTFQKWKSQLDRVSNTHGWNAKHRLVLLGKNSSNARFVLSLKITYEANEIIVISGLRGLARSG